MGKAVVVARVSYAVVPSNLKVDEIEWRDRVIAKHFKNAVRIDNVIAFLGWKQSEALNATSIASAARQVDLELQNSAAEFACITGRGISLLTTPGEDLMLFGPSDHKGLLQDTIKGLLDDFSLNPVIVANTEAALERLRGRPLAARLLAEALASSNAAAEIVGYVRVFESAFAMKHNQLKNRLHRFLMAGPLVTPKSFSDKWIENRHKVAHARDPNATQFSADVLSTTPRCREAAFDVAVNKKLWGSESIERNANALSSYVSPKNVVLTVDHYQSLNISQEDILRTLPTRPPERSVGFTPNLDRPEFVRRTINGIGGIEVEYVADRFGMNAVKFFEDAMPDRKEKCVSGLVPLFRGQPPTYTLSRQ